MKIPGPGTHVYVGNSSICRVEFRKTEMVVTVVTKSAYSSSSPSHHDFLFFLLAYAILSGYDGRVSRRDSMTFHGNGNRHSTQTVFGSSGTDPDYSRKSH